MRNLEEEIANEDDVKKKQRLIKKLESVEYQKPVLI